jgi:hypothetical protein
MHHFSNVFDEVILTTQADSQQNYHDKYLLRVYSVEMLLMMDSGPVRNM